MKDIFKYFVLISVLNIPMFGQNFDRIDVPIYDQGRKLSLANVGGLKAPQFSNVDFNEDGKLDLFVFDRNGNKILPFVKIGASGSLDYRFAPEYISQFPELNLFALLVDYNRDGIKDIFTGSTNLPGSVEVWKGKRDLNGKTSYEILNFTNSTYRNVLHFSNDGSSFVNVYVSLIDLPAIVDVDGDGDIDIVSFEPDGSFASFYRNLSVEQNLDFDQFKFDRPSICWGGFSENQFNEIITLSNDTVRCAQSFAPGNPGVRHSGSTLTIYDANGDGLMDLLIGDLGSSKLKKLVNRGWKKKAWMKEVEINFPADDVAADIEFFPASYFVDVDDDGKRDLIVAPNEINSAENNDHVWFYKNVETDSSPKFQLIKKNFLTDEMAYFFGGSHPTFEDVDGDGLLDLVIGTTGIKKKNGERENRMFLLQNVGKSSSPEFNILNNDYLSFSNIDGEDSGRFAPSFGDLDGDGARDLLIGDAVGRMFFLKNQSPKGAPYQFGNPVYPYFNIFVGQNAKPFIADVDADGLLDLVVGKRNNELNLFKNIGQKSIPTFNANLDQLPNQRQFGRIFSGNNSATQNGSPIIIEESGGNKKLIIGSNSRNFRVFDMNTIPFTLISEDMGNISEGINVVSTFADIDNDGYYEMAVGNERGGLAFYNTIFMVGNTTAIGETTLLDIQAVIYPNPAKDEIFVFNEILNTDITLHDMIGNEIMKLQNNAKNTLPQGLSTGIYLIKFRNYLGMITKKVVIYE